MFQSRRDDLSRLSILRKLFSTGNDFIISNALFTGASTQTFNQQPGFGFGGQPGFGGFSGGSANAAAGTQTL